MKKSVFLVLICLITLSSFAQKSEELFKNYGTFLRLHLSNAPFPHTSRAEGYPYQDKFFEASQHYQDSTILVFIPKYFKASPKIDLVFYFHGWFSDVDSALQQFHLIEQFCQAQKNAILVLPELARRAPDSKAGKLEENQHFRSLVDSIILHLQKIPSLSKSRLNHIILAGHSGGYRSIAYTIFHGGLPISEVYLFDGLYGQLQKFAVWIIKNPKSRFINIYSSQSPDVKANSEQMIEECKVWQLNYRKHNDKSLNIKDLETGNIHFIATDLDHYQSVYLSGAFYKCLLSSPFLKENK